MRICANENIPEDCIIRMRQAGHDVLWIRDAAPGISDREVLQRALSEGRILITFDKDFGALVYAEGVQAACGIILFRLPQPSASAVSDAVTAIIASRQDWTGHFSVVDEVGVRMKRLP